MKIYGLLLFIGLLVASSCTKPATMGEASEQSQTVMIAAAANLESTFTEIGKAFQADTGIKPIFSFGATGSLAKQIENGAPFDLFAAADLKTIDSLETKGELLAGSKRIYARGMLVVSWPQDSKLIPATLADIARPEFKRIAIAKPDVAPYGAAAKESLEKLGLWAQLQSRVVYGENVNAVNQYVRTGNVELGFIPLSLVKPGEKYLLVDEKLHKPIDQALGIVKQSKQVELARKFDEFLRGGKARAIFERYGYVIP